MKKVETEKEFKVTPAGSLGILALGSVGLRIWRKSVEEHKKELAKKNPEENGKSKK